MLFPFCKPLQSYMVRSQNILLFAPQLDFAMSACWLVPGRTLVGGRSVMNVGIWEELNVNPQVGYVKAAEAWDLNVKIQKFPEEIFAL